MIKCILFDCDGTLVDSEMLASIGLSLKFQELGVQLEPDELVRRFRGWNLDRLLKELCHEHAVFLPDSFVPSYRRLTSELFDRELKPIEGIHAALESLPHNKAVVSSGPSSKIKKNLEICGLSRFFTNRIYSSYDSGYWKPDPKAFLYAANDLGYGPHECVVVDDGLVGIESAVKAGMRTLFFNRFGESCEYDQVESFFSMESLPDLLNE